MRPTTLATDTWSSKAVMPTARYGLAAAAVNGIVYAVGGNPGGYVTNIVEAYRVCLALSGESSQ